MSVEQAVEWPTLSDTTIVAMVSVCIGSLIGIWVLLRVVWKPPQHKALLSDQPKEEAISVSVSQLEYDESTVFTKAHITQPLASTSGVVNPIASTPGFGSVQSGSAQAINVDDSDTKSNAGRVLASGEVAGDYSEEWYNTFDATFLGIMSALFLVCAVLTTLYIPDLWYDYSFWACSLAKCLVMMLISAGGGVLCRHFCEVDNDGYVITTPGSKFKVNYTRKIQHFAAYLVPIVLKAGASNPNPAFGSLYLAWGQFFTMLAFLVLIKPLRECSSFIMIQFNSMDRPEDRPNTMKWLIGGNIIPGTLMIVFFTHLYAATSQQGLCMIFIFITGLGDGLAEPVGIAWGRHKYQTTACCSKDKFTRSWEGSACVFMSGVIFPCTFYDSFANEAQMWMAILILPVVMAYAEATAPHTMDTPVLMGLGGLILWGISQYTPGL